MLKQINKQTGFTLIEVLIAIAIIFIISAMSISGWRSVSEGINLKDAISLVETQIKLARTNSLSALSDANYGIRFETGSITLFKGNSYTAGDPNNTVYNLASGVEIYDIALSGGGGGGTCNNNGIKDGGEIGIDCGGGGCLACSSDLVFNRLVGTSNSGTFGIRLIGNPSVAKQIYVNNQGQVSASSFEASTAATNPEDIGNNINARHIHFDIPLTWSINSSTTSILRLKAADGTTQNIDTGSYFNGGVFDWQGAVTLNGESHKLRIHTIGGGNLLCIIRDRTENDSTLTVSFIDGTEKVIVAYIESGGMVTVTPGLGVLTPIEPQ